jgi:signal transduction histidine kinase
MGRDPGHVVFFDTPGPLRQHLRVAAMQGRLPDFGAPVVFITAEDRKSVDDAERTFATAIAISLAVLAAGLITAVFLQVRVGLSPLFALRREVAALRTGESESVTGSYPTELQPLAAELNALMKHTQEVVERQRTHVGNLAHALKTPLSVMIAEAQASPGPLAEVVQRQAGTMSDHVDHHLRRARAAARAQGPGERTPLAPVLDELARTLERIFQDKVSEIEWTCPEDLVFLGERQDLLEIAGNVMENACKWSRSFVRARGEIVDPRQLRLVVEDDGPGLDPAMRTEVLRRGTRLDERTPGSGLGLAIVDELVRAYGGTMSLGGSELGGLSLTIELPRAEA